MEWRSQKQTLSIKLIELQKGKKKFSRVKRLSTNDAGSTGNPPIKVKSSLYTDLILFTKIKYKPGPTYNIGENFL